MLQRGGKGGAGKGKAAAVKERVGNDGARKEEWVSIPGPTLLCVNLHPFIVLLSKTPFFFSEFLQAVSVTEGCIKKDKCTFF